MSAILRSTTKKELWVISDRHGYIIAFGSGGRTSYLTQGAAEKALEQAIIISNTTKGTNLKAHEFTVQSLQPPSF